MMLIMQAAPLQLVQWDKKMTEIPLVVQKLTNLFENGDTNSHPDYCEDLGDGRGFTCGIVGFTSATGDALEVVERWTSLRPDNSLAPFLPALRHLAKSESGDVDELDGFDAAWVECAGDAGFRGVQDEVAHKLYGAPALKYAQDLGIKSALGIACLYDAMVQHGDGDDPDSIGAMLRETTQKVGRVSELQFIPAFLTIRHNHLTHAHDAETRKVWAESADRCRVLADLARAGNWELKTPFEVKSSDYDETIY